MSVPASTPKTPGTFELSKVQEIIPVHMPVCRQRHRVTARQQAHAGKLAIAVVGEVCLLAGKARAGLRHLRHVAVRVVGVIVGELRRISHHGGAGC